MTTHYNTDIITNIQTYRPADIHTYIHTYIHTDRQTDRQTDRLAYAIGFMIRAQHPWI